MKRLAAIAAAIIVASFACGKPSLPQKPQLLADRDSLGFGLEYNSATFIGTRPQDSIQISNGGLDDLIITSTTLSGDPVFTIEGPLKTTIKGKETTFIRVVFAPTAEKEYKGEILIVSNAENAPMKKIGLSGRGLHCQGLPSVTDGGGCKVTWTCSDAGEPSVSCHKPGDGGTSLECTCLKLGPLPDGGTALVSLPLQAPTLCGLSREMQLAQTRNVCGWSL